jgi:hypothetical protein
MFKSTDPCVYSCSGAPPTAGRLHRTTIETLGRVGTEPPKIVACEIPDVNDRVGCDLAADSVAFEEVR